MPGVTSGVAAPAYAGIPVTDRVCAIGLFWTGTEKPGNDRHDWQALARLPTLVIYMGVGQFPGISASLLKHGKDPQPQSRRFAGAPGRINKFLPDR